MNDSTNTSKKIESRKFIIWLVWLVITIAISVYTFIVKDSTLLEKVIDYLFCISLMYLGLNVGQKGIYAFADVLKNKYSNKEKEDE